MLLNLLSLKIFGELSQDKKIAKAAYKPFFHSFNAIIVLVAMGEKFEVHL